VYSSPEDWIDVGIREPESERGYFSKLVTTPQSRRCLNLGSYNYLGFGGLNTHCTPLVAKSVMDYPVTSAGSAAELGYNTHVKQVEETTAKFVGKDSAVVVGMGFATNSTVIPALCGAGDLILSDALNHNSIVEGARLSGAKIKAFKHNCVGDLELLLQQAVAGKGARYNKILVIVEGIYSMEGELCKLPAIVEVCKLYGAYVWLDEAHSIGAVGATGRGVCEELGVDPADIDVMMGTFTKSFGAAGGYVAGDAETVARVRQYSAGCTDAVSMPPAVCTQILASLRVIAGEDGTDIGAKKLCQLRDNALFFRQGLEALGLEVLGEHPSPVMPVMLYQPYKIGDFSRLAFNRKLAVVVVGAPATPVTYPRVRFCVSAAHSREDLADALAAIGDIADELQIKFKLYPPARNALFGGATGSLSDVEKREEREREKRLEEALAARPAALEAAAALSGGRNTAKFAPLHSRGAPLGDDLGAPVTKSQKSSQGPADSYSLTGITAQPKKYDVVLSSQDVLGLTDDQVMKEECAATVETLGLGSCSPRGFYGTFPPHMDVEKSIAEFLGVQEAVLYSFGACTVSSVIPALAHRSDVAVVDRGVGHGVLAGLRLSKMDVRWYNHGDAEDCARVFANLEAEDGVTSARLARPGRRRWLITEGCFAGTGRIAPLPALLDLKDTHHARLILDESSSFGAMGATGRGITEHFGVDAARVDVIAASLENAGASVGGFCAGDTGVVAYQRLMGSGYVFSASLPPYLATAAAHAIRRVSAEPRLVERAQASAAALRDAALSGRVPGFTTDADACSPIVPLRLAVGASVADENALLADVAARARRRGIGVCVARVNPLVPPDRRPPRALRCFASTAHTREDLATAFQVLAEESAKVLPSHALSAAVDASPGAKKRLGADPGSMVMNPPGQQPPKAGGYGSPKNAPGAKVNLDGTISLNNDSVKRDLFANGSSNGVGEVKASPSKQKGAHNRSASWSVNSMNGGADNAPEMFEALSPVKESPIANGSASTGGAPRRMFSDQDSPQSLSVPLLVVLLYWHNIFRRYILNQIDITTHMVPKWLARIGLHPTESRGPVRFFYCAAGYFGSRNFHSMALPLMVWTYDCGFTRLVMVFYCMTSGVGCLLKGALATNTSSSRPANSSLGSLMPHRVHAWPSVAGCNATALPFLILRWRHGDVWLWDMANQEAVVREYAAAFAYMFAISLARMGNGDSPANVQGGVVVGAIMLRVLLPHIDWCIAGLEASTVFTAQGFTIVGMVLAAILLFPMPLNSRGEILYASSTCYRRMWRTFFYMLFFAAGSVWREGPAAQAIELPTTPAGWAGVLAAKFFVGHVISQFSVWAISYVSQLFVECWLRAYVKYFKPWSVGEHRRGTGGEEDGESKTYGTTHMRLVAITVVELAQDITGALVTAHGVPRLFDTLRSYTSLRI
jgi:serine palmitoyltransferase